MLASRRLERVSVNLDHAQAVIVTAQRHLVTAEALAGTDDVAMAFTAAYDGTPPRGERAESTGCRSDTRHRCEARCLLPRS